MSVVAIKLIFILFVLVSRCWCGVHHHPSDDDNAIKDCSLRISFIVYIYFLLFPNLLILFSSQLFILSVFFPVHCVVPNLVYYGRVCAAGVQESVRPVFRMECRQAVHGDSGGSVLLVPDAGHPGMDQRDGGPVRDYGGQDVPSLCTPPSTGQNTPGPRGTTGRRVV